MQATDWHTEGLFEKYKWLNIKDLYFRNCFLKNTFFRQYKKMQVLDNKALAFLSISKI